MYENEVVFNRGVKQLINWLGEDTRKISPWRNGGCFTQSEREIWSQKLLSFICLTRIHLYGFRCKSDHKRRFLFVLKTFSGLKDEQLEEICHIPNWQELVGSEFRIWCMNVLIKWHFLAQVVVLIFAIRRQYCGTANHSTLALYLIACQCFVSCNVDFICVQIFVLFWSV